MNAGIDPCSKAGRPHFHAVVADKQLLEGELAMAVGVFRMLLRGIDGRDHNVRARNDSPGRIGDHAPQ